MNIVNDKIPVDFGWGRGGCVEYLDDGLFGLVVDFCEHLLLAAVLAYGYV